MIWLTMEAWQEQLPNECSSGSRIFPVELQNTNLPVGTVLASSDEGGVVYITKDSQQSETRVDH